MKKLIIDGKSVYEIDLDCMKKNRIPTNCDVQKHLQQNNEDFQKNRQKLLYSKKRA